MQTCLPTHFDPLPFEPIHGGEFSVTIAQSQEEVIEAQKLRYHVFVEEMKADIPAEAKAEKRDYDAFDEICDHLLVRYHETPESKPRIIGTYRMLRDSKRPSGQGFYSEDEYDIAKLKAAGGNLLEVGRSCTHPEFRNKSAMQLLWRGIGEYVMHYDVDYLFGCASFEGTDPQAHAQALSYLYHNHRAEDAICPRTLEQYHEDMNLMPKDEIDEKRAFFKLPILVKGYLRLGGVVGDGAFIDHAFNTTDIFIIVQTSNVSDKHLKRYSPDSVAGGA